MDLTLVPGDLDRGDVLEGLLVHGDHGSAGVGSQGDVTHDGLELGLGLVASHEIEDRGLKALVLDAHLVPGLEWQVDGGFALHLLVVDEDGGLGRVRVHHDRHAAPQHVPSDATSQGQAQDGRGDEPCAVIARRHDDRGRAHHHGLVVGAGDDGRNGRVATHVHDAQQLPALILLNLRSGIHQVFDEGAARWVTVCGLFGQGAEKDALPAPRQNAQHRRLYLDGRFVDDAIENRVDGIAGER